MRRWFLLLSVALLAGCSAPSVEPAVLPSIEPRPSSGSSAVADLDELDPPRADEPTRPERSPSAPDPVPVTTTRPVSPLADLVVPAGSAIPDDSAQPERAVPAALRFDDIGVEDASIVPVGVLEDGQMEIPGRTEIGWYRFGPAPGSEGSAVLAAHIAVDNRSGVFRNLSQVELADRFTVGFEDGTEQTYEVFEIAQYHKTEVPFARVFSRSGDPVVVLISCGGVFDRSAGSYEDNIVAYARPTADAR